MRFLSRNKFMKELRHYNNKLEENFEETLNEMINEINSSINIDEYSKVFPSKQNLDPLYNFKSRELERDKTLGKFDEAIKRIPESNGSRLYERLDLRVGIVADEYLYDSFKDVVNLEYIPMDAVEIKQYDFVIFTSVWEGLDGSWEGSASPHSEERAKLHDLIKVFNGMNVPTIYYSTEDIPHFELFKSISKYCDYIFTTAVEMIDSYQTYLENENIHVLQPGVNPFHHNPVGSRTYAYEIYKKEVLFQGNVELERPRLYMRELQLLFDPILSEVNSSFTIIDNNLNMEKPRGNYPEKYIPYLAPPVDKGYLRKLHKIIRLTLNINTIKYSQTMIAKSIFELQAYGNIVISNYNTGVNNLFPNVRLINTEDDFKLIYNTSEDEIKDLQAKGIRNVFKEHTTFDRMRQIVSTIDINYKLKSLHNRILVVFDRDSEVNKASFDRQIDVNKDYILLKDINDVNLTDYDFITFFSEKYLYEEYYLEDMVSAFKYVDVDFVTKDNEQESHNYIKSIKDIYTSMIHAPSFKNIEALNQLTHGYNLDNVELLEKREMSAHGEKEKVLSVIVPIHNNGRYLEEKCFASLRRSSIFDKMEIIFVDDGSTDETTIKIINRLLRRYPDIVYVKNDKGSGSASRPRNQGVNIATTDYITYLDPDNEATGDGYCDLLEELKKDSSLDMVVGNIVREDNTKFSEINYYNKIVRAIDSDIIENPTETLLATNLTVQSIQALIVKKHIIKDSQLKMVEGAAGQDTLFYQELMLSCNKIKVVNKPIHSYYAFVEGSVTNTVTYKFFEKFYKVELERIKFLEKENLIDHYMRIKFNFYFKNWYFKKLKQVHEDDYLKACDFLVKMIDLYQDYRDNFDEEILSFYDQYKPIKNQNH